MKPVLVKVDEAQWAAMRSRALALKKPIHEVVQWAFRLYLGNRGESTSEEPRQAERAPAVESTGRRPNAAELAALINTVKPGSVTTGRRLTTTAPGDESGSQVRDDDDFNTF